MRFAVDDDGRLWELQDLGRGVDKARRAGDPTWYATREFHTQERYASHATAYVEKCIELAKRVKELTAIIEQREGARRVINLPNTD